MQLLTVSTLRWPHIWGGDKDSARKQAVAIHSGVLGLVMMFALADALDDPLKHTETEMIDALIASLTAKKLICANVRSPERSRLIPQTNQAILPPTVDRFGLPTSIHRRNAGANISGDGHERIDGTAG